MTDWLYAPGVREAHLLARLRQDAFADCRNVGHPGRFAARPAVAFYAADVVLARPARLRLRVRWNGRLRCAVDGLVVADGERHAPDPLPVALALAAGSHRIEVIVGCAAAPPALAVDGLPGAPAWRVSIDQIAWSPVRPVAGAGYPHDLRLRERRIRLRCGRDGLWSAPAVACGPVEVVASGRGQVTLFPGETPAEAANADARHHEQPPYAAQVARTAAVRSRSMALRWLRIAATPGVRVRSATLCAQSRGLALRGAFACSDPLLQRIWTGCAATSMACQRELVVDGLKRDRLPWAGDLWVAARADAATTADGEAVRDTLVALAPPDPGAHHVNNIVDYTPWWLVAIGEHRRRAGDLGLAAGLRGTVEASLAALAAACDRDGFLMPRPHDWLFLDWGTPEKRGVVAALQGAWLMALRAGAELVEAGGGDPAPWRERARRLSAAIGARLWDGARFADARIAGRLHGGGRHANLFAVLSRAGAAAQRRAAARVLAGDAPEVGTPFMRFAEALALAAAGQRGSGLAALRRHWGDMLERGATTFWEACDPALDAAAQLAFYGRPFAKSLCHAWASGPAAYLSEELPGLSPRGLGWSGLAWRPARTGLDWLRVDLPTPHGPVRAEVEAGWARLRAPAAIALDLPRGARRTAPGRYEVRIGG